MKKQVELRLIPGPGAKPEFLAICELNDDKSVPPCFGSLVESRSTIVLEGYTRDAWALDTATKWESFQVISVDGRNKLPGFVKYLRERKKTAFGRMPNGRVWIISHKQMSSTTLACRVASISKIPNCPLKPLPAAATAPATPAQPQTQQQSASSANTNNNNNNKKKKGFGLLGNLVGAQRRTNQQVQTAAIKKALPPETDGGAVTATATTNGAGGILQQHPPGGGAGAAATPPPPTELKTAGQVLAEFRQEMEQQMLDFDIAPDVCLKVKIDLASKLRLMSETEQQSGRVTMEILKYIVYEQAEEVNEEWIAHKEPSEFMDEAVIAIYKEGEAPPEVLEDINKADLPDEIRGQQRAIQQEQQKAQLQREQKLAAAKQAEALRATDDDFAVLNTNKRDRRTIEDYQREAKRERLE